MSRYSSFSSTSSESDEGIWTSNGSTYSTQPTAQSNNGADFTFSPQHFYGQAYFTGGEEPLLRDVGRGPNLELPSNPSTASANINGTPYGYFPPEYMQQYGAQRPTEDPFPARMQPNQGFTPQNPMAQGFRRIESHPMPNYDMNYPQMQPQLPYGYGVNQTYTNMGSVTSSQQSQSSSGILPILIERELPSASSRRKPKGPRYPCRLSWCPRTFSRPDSVERHFKTCHKGPYLVCDICGHWEAVVRQDKMRKYCRDKHAGQYSVRIEQSVGQQSEPATPSTAEKQSRRHKTPVW